MSRHLPAWARGSPQSQASPASPDSPKPYEPAWASESAAESEHSESSEHQLPDPTGMRLFACLEWACVAVAATVLAANGWLLFVLPFALKAAVQRVYIMLFCLVAIFAELNIWGFLNELSALENWVIKGLFCIFIGFGSLKNDEAIETLAVRASIPLVKRTFRTQAKWLTWKFQFGKEKITSTRRRWAPEGWG